jgi:hypothetical protein
MIRHGYCTELITLPAPSVAPGHVLLHLLSHLVV